MAKDPDEYKLIRYTHIMQRAFGSPVEYDKRRLVISSAALGFMVTRIPIDTDFYPCLIDKTFLEILWIIACGCLVWVIYLVTQTPEEEVRFFTIAVNYYEENNKRKIKKLKEEMDRINANLGLRSNRISVLLVVAILLAMAFITLESNLFDSACYIAGVWDSL